jgi:hypothetical protein
MTKSLLTPAQQSALVLAAYSLQSDADAEAFLIRVEKIVVEKLFESAETERLLGLSPKH